MPRTLKIASWVCLMLLLGGCAVLGEDPAGERLAQCRRSPNYSENGFANQPPLELPDTWQMTKIGAQLIFSSSRRPQAPLPADTLSKADFPAKPADLSLIWLGHSFVILEIQGKRLAIDPVFGNASPVPGMISRFQAPPIARQDLPRLDGVIISHDHYDHLEMDTVRHLAARGVKFIMPLGVGARLEGWGCPADQIVELDWGQSYDLDGLEIIAEASRHFSGRGLMDRNKTLWASWVIRGNKRRVFYSSDGGFDQRFARIGQKYGPFDLTMIECGAYNQAWPEVHMFPEQAVEAHLALGGAVMVPVHWAGYDLSLHRWDEPIRRTYEHAQAKGVRLATPRMGQRYTPGNTKTEKWWEGVEK